jgi:hypothetical protein
VICYSSTRRTRIPVDLPSTCSQVNRDRVPWSTIRCPTSAPVERKLERELRAVRLDHERITDDLRRGELGAQALLERISAARLAIWYVEQVDRLEIIAAIDAEIERLQHARSLVVQSGVGKRSKGSPETRTRAANVGKKRPVARDQQSIGRSYAARPTVIKEKPQVLVTRVPPKEPPKRRVAQAATKQRTALTGDVPRDPVAVAAEHRGPPAEAANNRAVTPISAFGLAITRGLGSLGS